MFIGNQYGIYKKYSLLLPGLGFIILEILTYCRVFIDLSKNAGLAMSVIGLIIILYSLMTKKPADKIQHLFFD